MEMEDNNHHNQYGTINLRQFISGRPTHFPSSIPHPHPVPDIFTSAAPHRNLQPPPHHQLQGHHLQHPHHHYDMMMLMPPAATAVSGGGLQEFHSDSSTTSACVAAAAAAAANSGTATAAGAVTAALGGLDNEGGSFGGDGGTGRWPRQETLTLLEIRSRLDSKFKEANQKGPLWDEVSRIMSEEHGYQRSGKKCREKFENLYKYYKKTKEGKAGRQDGKHYRFFRQLEALYGENSNIPATTHETNFAGNTLRFPSATNTSSRANLEAFHSHKLCDSLSLSNSSEFVTSSSEDNDLCTATLVGNDSTGKRRKRRVGKGWKTKIKDFIDLQMRKLMDRQEIWLEKLTKTLEQKEQERMIREEEWRQEESARMDRQHKFWAKERVWMEARDAALMEALKKLTRREVNASAHDEIRNQGENQNENASETVNNSAKAESWPESEIVRLFQLRTSMETRFQQGVCEEEVLWEEIAAKMACLGYERNASTCKDKWDSINQYLSKTKEGNKKRKENSRTSCYFQTTDQSMYTPRGPYCDINEQEPEALRLHSSDGSSPADSGAVNTVSDSCFRFLISEGENLWENYGLKIEKGDRNQ